MTRGGVEDLSRETGQKLNQEDHLVKWPVEKSNIQMSKCHLYKCQTSLAWVHKLVTHPSKIPDWINCSNMSSCSTLGCLAAEMSLTAYTNDLYCSIFSFQNVLMIYSAYTWRFAAELGGLHFLTIWKSRQLFFVINMVQLFALSVNSVIRTIVMLFFCLIKWPNKCRNTKRSAFGLLMATLQE